MATVLRVGRVALHIVQYASCHGRRKLRNMIVQMHQSVSKEPQQLTRQIACDDMARSIILQGFLSNLFMRGTELLLFGSKTPPHLT